MKFPIYMDNHATTPLDPRVLEAMTPYFLDDFGNAASRNHAFGWKAEEAVEQGRETIARLINCDPKELIFMSGATESDNLAIKGVAHFYAEKGKHIITCVTEHKAVLDTCKHLENQGFEVTYLQVDEYGQVDPDDLKKAIRDDTILVSIMFANNEIGTIHRISEIGAIAAEAGALLHCDATQAVGKIPVDVQAMNIHLMSFTAHKIYGPKGIGALYVRRRRPRVRLSALIHGGGHERGMRSGTLNVPGVVGFAKACELCEQEMATEGVRLAGMRDRLHQGIVSRAEQVPLNGHPTERLPGNLNLSFAYVEGESLLMGISEIAVSSGSACTSASLEPSYVIQALGTDPELAHSSIRFGLGRFNTEEEVDYATDRLVETVDRLREMSALWELFEEGVDLKTIEWSE